MIPFPKWRTNLPPRKPESAMVEVLIGAWVDSRPEADFITLWDEIIDPECLPYLAKAGGATENQLILAACAVARLCLHLVPEGEDRPRVAIETTEAWVRGEATAEQVKAATNDAYDAYERTLYPLIEPGIYADNISHAIFSAYCATTGNICANKSTTIAFASTQTLQAGIESQIICATIRKHLPFERPPRPKGLTIWQRLAKEEG